MAIGALTIALRQWYQEKGREAMIPEHFFRSFQVYRVEEPEEFARFFPPFKEEDFQVTIKDIALVLNSHDPDQQQLVVVSLSILFQGLQVGSYSLTYNLGGEIVDDALIIYEEKDRESF